MSKRTELSIQDKINLIERLKRRSKGDTYGMIAEEYNITKSTVAGIYSKRESLKRVAESQTNPDAKRGRLNNSGSKIDSVVFKWYCCARFKGRHLTGTSIKTFAVRASNALGITDFKASNGWLYKFLARHFLELKPKQKESIPSTPPHRHIGENERVGGSMDSSSSNSNGERAHSESAHSSNDQGVSYGTMCSLDGLSGYATGDLYACAVAPLLWRSISASSATPETQEVSPYERITVILTANALGNKLEPFVISKKSLASLKHGIDSTDATIDCYRNSNSWVTCELFQIYICKLNNRMKAANRRIMLLLDSAPFNCALELSNVKLHFLDKSSGSASNTIIMKCFHALYKIQLFQYVRDNISIDDYRNSAQQIHWSHLPKWIRDAWNSMDPSTIVSCFNSFQPIVQLDEAKAELGTLCNDIGNISVDEVMQEGLSLRTHEPLSDDWEEALLHRCQSSSPAPDSDALSDNDSISDSDGVDVGECDASEPRTMERVDGESVRSQQNAWKLLRGVIRSSANVPAELRCHVKALDEFFRRRWASTLSAQCATACGSNDGNGDISSTSDKNSSDSGTTVSDSSDNSDTSNSVRISRADFTSAHSL